MPHDNKRGKRLKILFLYDQYSVYTNTVYDHLDCFRLYSGHDVFFCHATQGAPLRFSLDHFDAILIHYSVRLAIPGHLSPEFESAIIRFKNVKVQFIQDEYDNTWHTSAMINRLGINVVFTCVPKAHIGQIYSRVRPEVNFVQVLTGYLPLDPGVAHAKPLRERRRVVGYRGRQLPYRYGKLAREKYVIGVRMREACEARVIGHDIEWTEDKRIYGPAWIDFVADCRVTLGSESGSNVFDFDGTLVPAINAAIQREPSLTFEAVFDQFLKDRELDGVMNQISPRVFEAIALRTGLVLFEGTYSSVIAPDQHFILLKKDFSNVDEVFDKIRDDRFLAGMTERAYEHAVASGQYTYQRFVRKVMSEVESRVGVSKAIPFVACVTVIATPIAKITRLENANLFDRPIDTSKLNSLQAGLCGSQLRLFRRVAKHSLDLTKRLACSCLSQVHLFRRAVEHSLELAKRLARPSYRLIRRVVKYSLKPAQGAAGRVHAAGKSVPDKLAADRDTDEPSRPPTPHQDREFNNERRKAA